MVTSSTASGVRVAALSDLRQKGMLVVSSGRHGIVLIYHEDRVYAVDNRCPHMGFPLSRGSCAEGILTCHWHHARFDLQSGGTFDPFADDVRVYPVAVHGDDIYVDLAAGAGDARSRWKARLQNGLEQNIQLVLVKSVLALLEGGANPREVLAIGARFGTRNRAAGWGPGLTILTALASVLPALAPEDRVLALYHGLAHTANDCQGQPPRFQLDPLPTEAVPTARLASWFRRFVEVRDAEGAERALLTAVSSGAAPAEIAAMLCAAATDHYFLAGGHTLDFVNKACELLDHVGWDHAAEVLPSVVQGLTTGSRAEEQNAWRHPLDLVALLTPVFAELPVFPRAAPPPAWEPAGLVGLLLEDEPAATVEALRRAIADGVPLADLARALAYAASLRVARFHTSNEFGDWITVLHTFTYCNALYQALKRAPSPELARGLFHGAMKIYLDRFLNIPAARLPDVRDLAGASGEAGEGEALLAELASLLDEQQQVNSAGALVWRYLEGGHDPTALRATLGHLLLREDGEFHSYQMLEAGFALHDDLRAAQPAEARYVLVAVARYLAAHAPTSRAMLQTARSALRLHRGEELFTASEA